MKTLVYCSCTEQRLIERLNIINNAIHCLEGTLVSFTIVSEPYYPFIFNITVTYTLPN